MNPDIRILKDEFLSLRREVSTLIDSVDTSKNTYLQNYLYFYHYPLFSFTESIISLCESGKHIAAKVLLRTLFEAHINIIYHQLGDVKHRLAVSAKDGFDTKIKGLKEIQKLIKKYPNLESADDTNLFSKKWLGEAEQWAEEHRLTILRGNNLKKDDKEPSLISKAIKCDDASIKNAGGGHFQRMYAVVYRQLSPEAHLNFEGVQAFVEKNETGKYLFGDGDGGGFLVSEAVSICLAYTRDLHDIGLIKGETLATVVRIEKILK